MIVEELSEQTKMEVLRNGWSSHEIIDFANIGQQVEFSQLEQQKQNVAIDEDIEASILISSFERLGLIKRTLWHLNKNQPSCRFEVIIADENNKDSNHILCELEKYDFPWKFIKCCPLKYFEETGITKYYNNSSWTTNVAFLHSQGDLIFHQGNEILAYPNCYDGMLELSKKLPKDFMIYSLTYNIPPEVMNELDKYATNFGGIRHLEECGKYPLQLPSYKTGVTNYISLASRSVWEKTGGYDENYMKSIAREDSDFTRRAAKIPGFEARWSGVDLCFHQYHGGVSPYYKMKDMSKWDEGVRIASAYYDKWDGKTVKNPQTWPIGLGVETVFERNY